MMDFNKVKEDNCAITKALKHEVLKPCMQLLKDKLDACICDHFTLYTTTKFDIEIKNNSVRIIPRSKTSILLTTNNEWITETPITIKFDIDNDSITYSVHHAFTDANYLSYADVFMLLLKVLYQTFEIENKRKNPIRIVKVKHIIINLNNTKNELQTIFWSHYHNKLSYPTDQFYMKKIRIYQAIQ
jgi:hypothetical protein